MKLTSTRDKTVDTSFAEAISHCMPQDGGLYVPDGTADLRKWILYTNEKTTFKSIAGALTSAFIGEEYSPIICETIATKAFPFEPVLKQLDDKLFSLELFHGPTGCYRDFGVFYLAAMLETTLTLENKNAILLDFTTGEHGALAAKALKGKKHIKSVLVYPKGKVCGLSEEDFIWNGGNIYPVEVDGDADKCHALIKEVFSDKELVSKLNLTVSTTANIGRLIPQTFFFTYAFTRLKNKVSSDIYYALDSENYGNLIAGLYSWRLSLPVSGFIVPATDQLSIDSLGNPVITDKRVSVKKRSTADASDPANLERLEDFFSHYAPMMKSFVYPAVVSDADIENAEKDLFAKYKKHSDFYTAKAYAASLANQDLIDEEGGAIVLVDRFHPAYSADFIKETLGETVIVPDFIKAIKTPVVTGKDAISSANELKKILMSVN
ncbi:MAG: threonine synthase [Treponema sp.]|nr:threonine synthase [Candidatus Treponema scatequi]